MRANSIRMDLATIAYWTRLAAAIMAAIWALIVVYDLVTAATSPRKILLHVIYAGVALVVVGLSLFAKPH